MKTCREMFAEAWRALIAAGGRPHEVIASPDVFNRYDDELMPITRDLARSISTERTLKFKNLDVRSDANVTPGTFYMT